MLDNTLKFYLVITNLYQMAIPTPRNLYLNTTSLNRRSIELLKP